MDPHSSAVSSSRRGPAATKTDSSRAVLYGLAAGLGAALLFGLSAPLAKRLLTDTGPLWLAGLLYLGAGLGLSLLRGLGRLWDHGSHSESRLRRQDAPLLLGITLLGGALAPVLMLLGLRRIDGVAGALLLNLEAPFTILLAVLLFREHLGRRARLAALLIVGGALSLTGREAGGAQAAVSPAASWLGGAALAGACLCWALDNNLTQRLSLRDPWAITIVKTLSAGSCNLALSLVSRQAAPAARVAALAMLVGFLSYGVSLLLDTYALRLLGAAREATIFSTAPFVGALAAVPLLGEHLGRREGAAFALMAGGVGLLARDRHHHFHVHEMLQHEHRHVHDDHHQHDHSPEAPPGEPHSHAHDHAPLAHEHPHVSDLHHRHRH